jgi:hypothetical protein
MNGIRPECGTTRQHKKTLNKEVNMDNQISAKHYTEWLKGEVSTATRAAAWPLVERLLGKGNDKIPVEDLLADARQTVRTKHNSDIADLVLADPIFHDLAARIRELA